MRVLSNGCNYDSRGIPRCGALLGAAYGSNSSPRRWERSMGRGLGVHRTYYDGDRVDAAVSTAANDLRHNRVPWISFKLPYSWEEMRDGRGDDWTRQLARRMAKLNGPVWLAFHHEPEGDGDLRAWTQMQQRLAPIVRRIAPNVAYSIILTGWNQLYGNRAVRLDKIWPRDQDRPGRLRRLRQVRRTDRQGEARPAHRLRAGLLPALPGVREAAQGRVGSLGDGADRPVGRRQPEVGGAHLPVAEPARRRRVRLLQHHAEQRRALAAQGRQGAGVRDDAAQLAARRSP